MLSLRSALQPVGLTALSALATRTGVDDPSMRRQVTRALIDVHHGRTGGYAGPVGIPMGDIRRVPGGHVRPCSGGHLELLDHGDGPQGFHEHEGGVRFVGFRCHEQSEGGPDEPYFIVGVQGTNESTTALRTLGPFREVESGTSHYLEADVTHDAQPPFTISVTAMDHDSGSPRAASAKVEEAMKKAGVAVAAALALLGPKGILAGAGVMAALELFGSMLAGVVQEVLDMEDDLIGQGAAQLFDWDAEMSQWRTPEQRAVPGFDRPHNVEIELHNGEGGRYSAYFQVHLFRVDREVVPAGGPDPHV